MEKFHFSNNISKDILLNNMGLFNAGNPLFLKLTMIAVQVILNIAVVTNTIPNTGISLPFLSYGGSSLIILLGSIGLLLNISRTNKKYEIEK